MTAPAKTSGGGDNNKSATTAAAIADSDATDEMRKHANISAHIAAAAAAIGQCQPKNTPSAVATPLPPRNRRKIENTCPATAAIPIAAVKLIFFFAPKMRRGGRRKPSFGDVAQQSQQGGGFVAAGDVGRARIAGAESARVGQTKNAGGQQRKRQRPRHIGRRHRHRKNADFRHPL